MQTIQQKQRGRTGVERATKGKGGFKRSKGRRLGFGGGTKEYENKKKGGGLAPWKKKNLNGEKRVRTIDGASNM